MHTRTRIRSVVAMAAALIMVFTSVAMADFVLVDVVEVDGAKIKTIDLESSTSTTVTYTMHRERDPGEPLTGQPPCNVSSENPGRFTVHTPSGVTANPTIIEFTSCQGPSGNTASVVIAATATGSGTVSLEQITSIAYIDVDAAEFTLNVIDSTPAPTDTTPPDITYTLDPVSPDGANGWYKGNVSLTWTVTEDESPASLVKDGCVNQTITTDQVETTYACSATSDGGSAGPVTVSIKRDGTAPTVAFTSASPEPNAAGWHNTDVTATFTATDNLSGFGNPLSLTTTDTAVTSGEGLTVTVGSPAFADNAGNTATAGAATSPAYQIDKTPPQVTLNGVTDGQTYYIGSSIQPDPSCSTSDALSGVATQATLSVSNPSAGTFVASCTGAIDVAGNAQAAPVTATYYLQYERDGGIGQPINPDGSSQFSQKRAVPVKFKLKHDEAINGFPTSGFTLHRQTVSCEAGSLFEDETTSQPTSASTTWRYDSDDDQYVFNANLSGTSAGKCYRFSVDLGDGGPRVVSAPFKVVR